MMMTQMWHRANSDDDSISQADEGKQQGIDCTKLNHVSFCKDHQLYYHTGTVDQELVRNLL